MNTHTAHFGFGVESLRAAFHLPLRATPRFPAVPSSEAKPGWLERLAIWAERQPMHHRMGSYTRMR